jgi:hypothetical protein
MLSKKVKFWTNTILHLSRKYCKIQGVQRKTAATNEKHIYLITKAKMPKFRKKAQEGR